MDAKILENNFSHNIYMYLLNNRGIFLFGVPFSVAFRFQNKVLVLKKVWLSIISFYAEFISAFYDNFSSYIICCRRH